MVQKLKVTDKKTGEIWIEENGNHSWMKLALHIMKRYPEFNIIYCDIECLAKGNTWKCRKPETLDEWYQDKQWYMLDEMGRYEPMPEEYVVEEIIDDAERTQS